MADVIGRYPLSTADGKDIPLDIIRPEGVVIIPVAHNASSTAFSLSDEIDCYSFHSTIQCLVTFAASSSVTNHPNEYTYYPNSLCVPAHTLIVVTPPVGLRSISCRSTQGNGQLVVQYLQTWSALTLKNQQLRR